MSFFVDIVSEDSFYENLTLGITKILEANPSIKNVQLERRGACDRAALSTWEQKHCCLLTEDLRNFYTSTDGFLLTWSLEISGEDFPIGRMEVKELSSLKRHMCAPHNSNNSNNSISNKEQQQQQQADINSISSFTGVAASSSNTSIASSGDEVGGKPSGPIEPSFGSSRCKLFELAECADCRVYLAFQLHPEQDEPSIWLHNPGTRRWYQLADNFPKYFRMMLVHLGLPLWQICASGLQLPTWIEQVYRLVGPHLLPGALPPSPIPAPSANVWSEGPPNLVDPAVFRSKDHHHGGGAKQKGSTATAAASSTTTNAKKKSSSH